MPHSAFPLKEIFLRPLSFHALTKVTGESFSGESRANEKDRSAHFPGHSNVRKNLPGLAALPNRLSFLHFQARLRNRWRETLRLLPMAFFK